jgi:MFS family permease
MEPIYRDLIKKSWHIIQNNKFLWIFGLFAGILGGTMGEVNMTIKNLYDLTNPSSSLVNAYTLFQGDKLSAFTESASGYFTTPSFGALLPLILLVIILVVAIYLIIVSTSALFYCVNKISKKQKTNFEEGFQNGRSFFKPVFLLNLIAQIFIWGIIVILSAIFISFYLKTNQQIWYSLYITVLIIMLAPVSVVVSFLIKFATAYIVLKGKKIGESIKLAWSLFIKNWLISIEVAIILFLINFIIGVFVILIILLILIPILLLGNILSSVAPDVGSSITLIVALIFIALIIFVIGSALSAYQVTIWTLLFNKLEEKKSTSKLVRLFASETK